MSGSCPGLGPPGVAFKSLAACVSLMTEQAARKGFEQFVDDAFEVTREVFSVSRAVTGSRGVPGSLVDRIVRNSRTFDRRVVEPELAEYRDQILDQFEVLIEYTVDPDATREGYADAILRRDAYLDSLRDDVRHERRQRLEQTVLDRQLGLGEAIEPLVESDRSAFWPAVRDVFTREQATAFVEEQFRFAGPLREHADAFRFTAEFDPETVVDGALASALTRGMPTTTIEFTDEAVRSITRAEERVVRQAKRTIDREY